MKSTLICFLCIGIQQKIITTTTQAFNYEVSKFGNEPATAIDLDEQNPAVQNSWSSDDFGYGDQDGYELPVQPNYYNPELDPEEIQQYSDYVDELQNLQNIMEQGYGSNQDDYENLSRNNGQDYSDYLLNSPNFDYNGGSSASSSSSSSSDTYPSPPNPCPKINKNSSNFKAENCIPDMPDTAEFSQMYQAINKNGEGSKMDADMLNNFFQTV